MSEYKPELYKRWYDQNQKTQYARVRQRKLELRAWMEEYKAALACIKCGESTPICLDFHHREASEKESQIANAVANGWGKDRILREIAKCDVLCANCHRKEHASLAQR